MTPASPPSPDPAALFASLATLETWSAAPARPRRLLARGLEELAGACGAAGIHLEASLGPGAQVGGGWGSLAIRMAQLLSCTVAACTRTGPM